MRFGVPGVALLVCAGAIFGQQPAPPPPPLPPVPLIQEEDAPVPEQPPAITPTGGLHGKAPLTEQQKREQQIRALDLTFHGDPSADPADKPADTLDLRKTSTNPLKGSVAASGQVSGNPRNQGPQVIADDSAVVAPQDFAGPAVLSRAYTINRPLISQQLNWTPTFSVNSIYSGGMTGSAVQPGGKLDNASSFGTTVAWSLQGRHLWKRDQLSFDTHGDFNQYTQSSRFSGGNHNLNIDYGHEFSRHLSLSIAESLSLYSQSQTLANPALSIESSIANVNLAASPLTQILDAGLRQSSTSASVTWQKSARLSFSFGSGYFGVVRTGAGLTGNTGYSSNADVNYRISRQTTIGLYYSFSDYTYSHRVQISNSHTSGFTYSYAMSKSLQFRTRIGITRVESEGLVTVPIDPFIAALLGQTSRIIDSYRLNSTSDLSGEIAKDFGRSRTAKLSYTRGISPGNGVQLTSIQEALTGGFAMTVFRSYSVDLGIGDSTLSSAGQTVGKYGSRYGSIGLSHTYRKGLSATLSAYYRTFNITGTPVNHGQFSVSAGISWSPGENPVRWF